MKVLNFGSCNFDNVFRVDHIVLPGETISADRVDRFPGGKGLNQSIALARAGVAVFHAGCVGTDGQPLIDLLRSEGVDCRYLRQTDGLTGQAFIQVDKNGKNSIVIHAGANGAVDREWIDRVLADFAPGDILLTQNEISELPYLLEQAANRGMQTVLNPSPFNTTVQQIDLDRISYLMLNEVEAAGYAGTENPDEFLQIMKKDHPSLQVVLTLGEKGSVYQFGSTLVRQSAFRVKAVDTTAAGDTFTGYFLAGLIAGNAPAYALHRASAAAAMAVATAGAAVSIPTATAVERALPDMIVGDPDATPTAEEKVRQYLLTHLTDATLAGIAGVLGYSTGYTVRWLGQHMHTTFTALLSDLRCTEAARQLRSCDRPVTAIIRNVGYQNEGFFRKKFYEKYGCSPLEYRNRKKEIL